PQPGGILADLLVRAGQAQPFAVRAWRSGAARVVADNATDDHADGGRVASGFLGGLAYDGDRFGDPLEIGGAAGPPAGGDPSGPAQGGRDDAAQQDRRSGPLNGQRPHPGRWNRVELTVELGLVARPQPAHHLDVLDETRAALFRLGVGGGELDLRPAG